MWWWVPVLDLVVLCLCTDCGESWCHHSRKREDRFVLFSFLSYCLLLIVLMLEARPEQVMNRIRVLALDTSSLLMVASVFWVEEGECGRWQSNHVSVCICLCLCMLSFGVSFREALHYRFTAVGTMGRYRLVCSQ